MDITSREFRDAVRTVETVRLQDGKRTSEEVLFHDNGSGMTVVYTSPNGEHFSREWAIDENGFVVDPSVKVVALPDGGRAETQLLLGDNWELRNLPGITVPTEGAAIARTNLDAAGIPKETTFLDRNGQQVAIIKYAPDFGGRICEATQIVQGDVRFQVKCRYDQTGRMLEQTAWIEEQLAHRSLYTYNEYGDKATVVNEHEEGNSHVERFEYEYDFNHNWTLQRTYHSLGVDELRRSIVYRDKREHFRPT